MTTIDDIGRRAGRDALADAELLANADAGLARLLAESETEREPRPGGRRWAVVAALGTVAAAAVGLVVVLRDDSPEPVIPADPAPATTGQLQPTTTAVPSTTARPSTTAAPTTTPVADTLGVSYLSPPPLLAPDPFATVTVGEPSSLAIAPSGQVVVVDVTASTAHVVEPDGSVRTVPLDVAPAYLVAAGPGDVVYALRFEPPATGVVPNASIVAIALSGDRAGEVVASASVDPNAYVELPRAAFGNGPGGVVDRTRSAGETVIGYVDSAGQPTSWPGTPPPVVTMDPDGTVRSSTGTTWPLRIERSPVWSAPFEGETGPAASADGGAVVWTSIGPPVVPGADYSPPTIPVLAELAADGSAIWHQLPDDWSMAASDIGGTILARRDGDQLQLARLGDPPVLNDPVATAAEAIGASTLIARAPGRTAVFADGAATEVTVPPDVYVQSDGEFLWWTDATTSTAATLDGTIVCVAEGSLHRIRVEADGGYVASVESWADAPGSTEDTPVPNFAVDCETGERQPIEPISWSREGGYRFIQRVGDRTFEGQGDAEGNAELVNESGVSIDGDDYAGYHAFDDDGSHVAYLVMDALATPHLSDVLRARDTTTGELRWTVDLDAPAAGVWWYGDRVLAVLPNEDGSSEAAAVVVVDATTGDVVTTVPTTLDIAYVG